MEDGNDSSSNGSNSHGGFSIAGYEPRSGHEFSTKSDGGSLEKLLFDDEYDYTDAEIVVEEISVGVNRCILALRSQFFHQLFKMGRDKLIQQEGKPKYPLSELVPNAKIGYESFMVILNYLYTGKLKPPPIEVATCVDDSCAHGACGPAINYAVELMYASVTFQLKELVSIVQHHLLKFVYKAFVGDIIPVVLVAFHCHLNSLLSYCIQRVAESKIDDAILVKELPPEVFSKIKSLHRRPDKGVDHEALQIGFLCDKRIRRIYKAMDFEDIDLLRLLICEDPNITLDDAFALHYAAAYCDPKFVRELLSLDKGDVNLRNFQGDSVLHVAARRKEPSIILALLTKGASVSQATKDGKTAITLCQRLTQRKDYDGRLNEGQEINKDRLCIELLQKEMFIEPLNGTTSMSSPVVDDDLHMRLLFLENNMALARLLFPAEAKVAMAIADADFAGNLMCGGKLKEVDLNETPIAQEMRLQSRLNTLEKIGNFVSHIED